MTSEAGWVHVRETIRMLLLSIAQIEIALRESDESIEHLTDVFTSMVSYENVISMAVDDLPDTEETRLVRETIWHNAAMVTARMQDAIMAFQFYDKLTQRLSHVGNSMEGLGEILNDNDRIEKPDEWLTLQAYIKSKYSMREENELFDVVMKGGDIREAILKFNEIRSKKEPEDDIEFF
ncbi:MAG: hypothetical protein ACI845_003028 [Gammaproteobacteria bacterium]|jgi:hypothetical protein